MRLQMSTSPARLGRGVVSCRGWNLLEVVIVTPAISGWLIVFAVSVAAKEAAVLTGVVFHPCCFSFKVFVGTFADGSAA